MSIGLKIKELRSKEGITQDSLASYLGVSYQAISKWENDVTLPDIKLIKPISNFFGVTTDYLLDNENMDEEKFLRQTLDAYQTLSNKGDMESAIKLLKNGLKEYPKNYVIMSKLAQSLTTITKSTHEHMMKENAKEALKLCDIIISDSNDYGLIDSAISTKFYSYIDLKEYDKAIEVANHRPSIWHSKDFLLYSAYQGEEANNYLQKMILLLMDQLSSYIFSLTYKLKGGDGYSLEQKVEITKSAISIIETILNDGNYQFYSIRLRRFYTFLGVYFSRLGEVDEMYQSLEKAKELALYYDSLNKDEMYTSVIVNSQIYHPDQTVKNAEWSDFYVFKDRLKRKEFDEFRTHERFLRLSE
ncbi:MAG: helix-turn-helix domain-containing protein [Candidatus Izemoplasmataceae bacterium]